MLTMLQHVDSRDKSLPSLNEERGSENSPSSQKAIMGSPLNKAIHPDKNKSIKELHKEMSEKFFDSPKTNSEMDKEDWDSCRN